jgi:hypothetical protein
MMTPSNPLFETKAVEQIEQVVEVYISIRSATYDLFK